MKVRKVTIPSFLSQTAHALIFQGRHSRDSLLRVTEIMSHEKRSGRNGTQEVPRILCPNYSRSLHVVYHEDMTVVDVFEGSLKQ